jgi:trans-2,3-dihydro-3-hydroxyanthranilate isomerase
MVESTADNIFTYQHVDVFSERPLAGNGLAVVHLPRPLNERLLLEITRELRQFETVFLLDAHAGGATVRVFTPEEELMFAGHPVLGAAAMLHRTWQPEAADADWTITLGRRPLQATTHLRPDGVVVAEMNQGRASMGPPLDGETTSRFTRALGLAAHDVHPVLPARVVSTGLPYLLFPVTPVGLARSRVSAAELGEQLAAIGAEFVYVLEPDAPEGRTWDRSGQTEDVATGSAAGPAAAYLVEHGLAEDRSAIEINQGSFVGRPSTINVRLEATGEVWVGGPVAVFTEGVLRLTDEFAP